MEQLTAIAAKLGSDVPFFLYGGTALGLGRGEELYPLPDRPGGAGAAGGAGRSFVHGRAYRDLSATLTNVALQNKLNSFQRGVWGGCSER